jgi:hypothetical protein
MVNASPGPVKDLGPGGGNLNGRRYAVLRDWVRKNCKFADAPAAPLSPEHRRYTPERKDVTEDPVFEEGKGISQVAPSEKEPEAPSEPTGELAGPQVLGSLARMLKDQIPGVETKDLPYSMDQLATLEEQSGGNALVLNAVANILALYFDEPDKAILTAEDQIESLIERGKSAEGVGEDIREEMWSGVEEKIEKPEDVIERGQSEPWPVPDSPDPRKSIAEKYRELLIDVPIQSWANPAEAITYAATQLASWAVKESGNWGVPANDANKIAEMVSFVIDEVNDANFKNYLNAAVKAGTDQDTAHIDIADLDEKWVVNLVNRALLGKVPGFGGVFARNWLRGNCKFASTRGPITLSFYIPEALR